MKAKNLFKGQSAGSVNCTCGNQVNIPAELIFENNPSKVCNKCGTTINIKLEGDDPKQIQKSLNDFDKALKKLFK